MKASSKGQYVKAWSDHVNQLVYMVPSEDWARFEQIKAELQAMIEKQANRIDAKGWN